MNNVKDVLIQLKTILEDNKEILTKKIYGFSESIDNQLLLIYLSDLLGSEIAPYHYALEGCFCLRDDVYMVKMGEDSNGAITWPDDGKQPESGWYLKVSFPCGPYTLGQDYPVKSFNAMFEEMKGYGADHCDTANSSLYFNLETNRTSCETLYREYSNILMKYRDLSRKETLAKRIKEAEIELAKLKGE